MSWEAVRRWRDALRTAPRPRTALSPAGLDLVLGHALDALTDDVVHRVADLGGAPFERALFVAARTVYTAPIEWLAVLLGRGAEVTLKVPADDPGLGPWLADHAGSVGLPLTWTVDRDAAPDAPLVVVMGGDATVEEVRAARGSAKVLGFGHRFSAAWCDKTDVEAIAQDLACHDGRGCLSPAIVFTSDPGTAGALAEAMADAARRWPRGVVTAHEHAALRARGALASVLGGCASGDGWSVHRLPASRAQPVSLPRAAQLVVVQDADEAAATLRPWRAHLSTFGASAAVESQLHAALPAVRWAPPGTMQRPPVERQHDGVDWLRETLRDPAPPGPTCSETSA